MLAVTRLCANDALRWVAVGGLAVAVLACCVLPAILLGTSGDVGAGATQRTYDLDRDLALVPDLLPRSLVLVVPALVLVGVAVAGLGLGSRPWVALTAFVASLALVLAAWRVDEGFAPVAQGGVVGCDSPCAGFVLEPAVHDLNDDLLHSPAGRRPGFELLGGRDAYRAEGLGAWTVLLRVSIALALLGVYAFARLAVRPLPAVAIVAATAFVVFVWLVWLTLTRLE